MIEGVGESGLASGGGFDGSSIGIISEGGDGIGGGGDDALAIIFPSICEAFEEDGEADAAALIGWGKVSSTVEGLEIWGEENRHRPTAAPGGGLDIGHVDAIDIGAFFAVDFDADEKGVEEASDGGIFEGFVSHDMAPVAGGIADGEEDGFVFLLGFGKGFWAPGIPVDGVILVLEKVGGFFFGEAIGEGGGWGHGLAGFG